MFWTSYEKYRNAALAWKHYQAGRIGVNLLWEVLRHAPSGYWADAARVIIGGQPKGWL